MNSFRNGHEKFQCLITAVRNYFSNNFFTTLLQISPLQLKYNCVTLYCASTLKAEKCKSLLKVAHMLLKCHKWTNCNFSWCLECSKTAVQTGLGGDSWVSQWQSPRLWAAVVPGFLLKYFMFMKFQQSLAGKHWAPGCPSLEMTGAFKTFTSFFSRLYWSHLSWVFVALGGCLSCSRTSTPCSLFHQWACEEEIRLWW